MAHFANRSFSDDGFVISNIKGLAFDMTCMVWPTKLCRVFWTANINAKHSFSIGLYRCSTPIMVLLR